VVGVTNRHPRFLEERRATVFKARSLAHHEAQKADVGGLANVTPSSSRRACRRW
jgi:hypothetical protein